VVEYADTAQVKVVKRLNEPGEGEGGGIATPEQAERGAETSSGVPQPLPTAT
jgi:hypothetical protein